jgi:hypothetical protein
MSDSYVPQGQNTLKPHDQSESGGDNSSLGREKDLAEQAKNLGRDLKNKAADLTDTVTRAAKDHAAELGSAAKDIASGAAGKVQSVVSDQKGAGADYIQSIARAVNRAAGEFEQDIPPAAQYIRQAASQIDSVATAVRERDVRELVAEVETFARRQPTLFFGGAVVLGFAALRFFKSSSQASGAARRGARYDEFSERRAS